MNTEEDFQKAIDEFPTDGTLKMAFADWLDEQDPPDPRAAGYRAMGRLGINAQSWPAPSMRYLATIWVESVTSSDLKTRGHTVPRHWFDMIAGTEYKAGYLHRTVAKDLGSIRELNDEIALAWSRLAKEEQEAILPTEVLS